MPEVEPTALWPLVVYFAAVLVVVGSMIGLSYVLGERHVGAHTGVPYESGIAQTGTARLRFDVKFYLNAMFFVVFDLEAAFVVAWAISARELGWPGYLGLVGFVLTLLVALVYLSRLGALDWWTATYRRRRTRGPS